MVGVRTSPHVVAAEWGAPAGKALMEEHPSYRIVVAEPFDPEAIARLQAFGHVDVLSDSSPQTILAAVPNADALLVRNKAHVTARIIEAAGRLKVIGRAAPNIDHIDLRAAGRRNIPVVYTPHMAVTSTAEFTLAMILALHRRLPMFDRQIRGGQFETLRAPAGRELAHETIAFLGIDSVAERLGHILQAAFRSRIVFHDPAGKIPVEFTAESMDLDALLAAADILVIHLPMSPTTKRLINADRLALMRPTAILVNASRGGVVDTAALATALQTKRLGAAGLDVFEVEPLPVDHPIRRAPNCLLTPHVAAATIDAATSRFQVTDDVIRVLSGHLPLYAAENGA